MSVRSPHEHTDFGQTVEQSGNHFTIQSAYDALETARVNGQTDEIEISLIRLAHLNFRQGRYVQTQTLAEEVLCNASAASTQRCDALRMLGNCAAELGYPDQAEDYYHQAIDLARQLGYRYALFKCLHSLATNIYWPRGQFGLCLAAGKEALAQGHALDVGEELWFPLSDIAWVYWSTGQHVLADQIADQMQSVVSPGSLGDGFYCCLRAGQVSRGEKYLSMVIPLYDRARSIAEATGDPGLNMEVRLGLCKVYRMVQNLPAARSWAEDAVAFSERMNYRQFQAVALIERGQICLLMGNLDEAEADLAAASVLAAQLHANFDLARANLYLAAALSKHQSPEASVIWQKTAGQILEFGYGFLIEQERLLVLPWIAANLNASEPELARTCVALFDQLAQNPPAALNVKTFGQYSLCVGDSPIAKEALRQRRAGELLALLISAPGSTLSAEQVCEAMCPEKDPNAAADFYHHAISALRRLLEPDLPDRRFPCRYLEVTEDRVTLCIPSGSKIDSIEFERFVQRKEWARAVEIYQGEYLPVYCYAEWAISLRQHFADQFEYVLLAYAQEKFACGEAVTCLDLVRRVLLHNAWQEQAVELGMRAALALGDRATALKLFQRLEKKLGQDLGIAPQAQIQELYTELLKRPKKR